MYNVSKLSTNTRGTSLAAPFFAGFVALTGYKTFINHIIYSNTCFHDITVGSNSIGNRGEYFATPGYDNCTGLGSMDCSKFLLNPYILLPIQINIRIGRVIPLPFRTNVTITWSVSNNNVLIRNGYMIGINAGTSIIRASANHMFALMTVNIIPISFNLKKMIFTK
jgi:hypothetical protein